MIKEIYLLRQDKDLLLKDLIEIRQAYKKETGKEYEGDGEN